MNKKDYSGSQKNLIRFFCVLGIVVEVLCILRLFIRSDFNLGIPNINNITDFSKSDLFIELIDFISLIVFVVLLFIPEKFVLFSLVAFFYSFKIIAVETVVENPIGILLYTMGVSCLLFKGFYRKHSHRKTYATLLLYLGLISLSMRFGIMCFINSVVYTLGYGLAMLVSIFFVVNFLKIIYEHKTARVLDLSQYPELTLRDKEWLRDILDEKKYEEIAADSGITVGTLKNRMHQIFNIVGIDDRISLLATYGGYEVKF